MLTKDEREERRQRMRDAVRNLFKSDPEPWLDRYRGTYEVEVQAGATERKAHEVAIGAALDSFVNKAIGVFANARIANRTDRYRMMTNKKARKALRGIVESTFRLVLSDILKDLQEAREMAALLVDRAADTADNIGDFLGALAGVLEGDDDDEPEVIEAPHREPIVSDRKPGIIGGIPVMEAPTRAPVSASEVIEIPGE